MNKPVAALAAGTIGIIINTVLLKIAAPLGIQAESGGLLRLTTQTFAPLITQSGIGEAWTRAGLPPTDSVVFWLGFHLATGLGMALLYAFVCEPFLPGNGLLKGSLFARAVVYQRLHRPAAVGAGNHRIKNASDFRHYLFFRR
jgi:hypothetical protein